MSHELRTPLNALVGLLELESRARPGSENLRIARQSADAMIDLVGDILDLDRIESGRMQLAPRPVDLAALLRESLELFAARAREKGLALQLDCALPAHRLYRVDPCACARCCTTCWPTPSSSAATAPSAWPAACATRGRPAACSP